jgi:CheY-like chemotaxis protein
MNLFRKAKPQVLVVEDNIDHWLIIRWALLEQFAEVEPVWVSSLEETVSFLRAQKNLPKLILLDLYLPSQQAGLALLRTIKSHDLYRNIPVITLSSSDTPNDIVQSYQLHSNSYIVKPGNYEEWLACFAQFGQYW